MEEPAPPSHKQIWLEYVDRKGRFCRIRLKCSPKLGRYQTIIKQPYWAVVKLGKYSHFLQLIIHPEASEADIQEAVNAFLKLVNGKLVRYYRV
jgi:hypothetical protein